MRNYNPKSSALFAQPFDGYVVLTKSGCILGTYGGELRSEAAKQVDKLRKNFPRSVFQLRPYSGQKHPQVGDFL
jgi:hypothetical protein